MVSVNSEMRSVGHPEELTECDVRREVQRELRQSSGDVHGVQAVGRGHGVRLAAVNCDSAPRHPARDAYIVREWFVRVDRCGERVAERVERVYRHDDLVTCETCGITSATSSNGGCGNARAV